MSISQSSFKGCFCISEYNLSNFKTLANYVDIVKYIPWLSLIKQRLPWLILGHVAMNKFFNFQSMYPDRDTIQQLYPVLDTAVHDQNMAKIVTLEKAAKHCSV